MLALKTWQPRFQGPVQLAQTDALQRTTHAHLMRQVRACTTKYVFGFESESFQSQTGAVAEKWGPKVARLRRASPFGHLPYWGLRPVIVKSGDDCRQELMAVQIVSKLQSVFLDAGLPLWLRPFEVCLPVTNVFGIGTEPRYRFWSLRRMQL